jgi:hypothetical protein|tara:strand:+ start:317 stop:496 length:180 start_codon:yes stop_codon:yes gene_type:complete
MKIIQIIVICSLFVLVSCTRSVKDCKIKADLEKIGESALKNKENLSETELRQAQMSCNF